MKKRMGICVVILAVFLAGCGEKTEEKAIKKPVEKKVYKESTLVLPEGIGVQCYLDENGVLNYYTYDIAHCSSKNVAFSLHKYESGVYVKQDVSDLNKAIKSARLGTVQQFYKVGNITYGIRIIPPTSEKEVFRYEWYKFQNAKATKQKNIFYHNKGSCYQILRIDNECLAQYSDGSLVRLNLADSSVVKEYKGFYRMPVKILDDIIYTVSADGKCLELIDAETEESLEKIPMDITTSCINVCQDEDKNVYCISRSGIYQIDNVTHKSVELFQGKGFTVYALANSDRAVLSDFSVKDGIFTAVYTYYLDNQRKFKVCQYREQ